MAIQLTPTDIENIKNSLKKSDNGFVGDTPNYANMYQYIFDTYDSQMEGKQKYWFQQAAQINAYLNYVAEPSKYQYTARRLGFGTKPKNSNLGFCMSGFASSTQSTGLTNAFSK